MAMLSDTKGVDGTTLTGVSHDYTIPSANRTWILNFVKFTSLEPHKTYYYKVKSGMCDHLVLLSWRPSLQIFTAAECFSSFA